MKLFITKNSEIRNSYGSALILAVVLSSLLAIVGVLFVLAARVNSMATSAITETKDLDLAIESVVAKISQQLVSDVPGVFDSNEEYYDFPDANNLWLADLEPYRSGGNYFWGQISDVTGALVGNNRNIQAEVVSDYAPVDFNNLLADADGDGVGDSVWVSLYEVASGRGRPIYAAVRIIDNGAMLNVNTAYNFEPNDPNTSFREIDGSSQLQINLMALAGRPGIPPTTQEKINLLFARANNGIGVNPLDLSSYEQLFIWNFDKQVEENLLYTPFDISDELELRYRFLLDHEEIGTRLENWGGEFRDRYTLSTPVTSGGEKLDKWFMKASGGGGFDPNYAYRHIATTYNMDRIINPAGSKMVNINTPDPNLLYDTFYEAFADREPNLLRVEQLAGHLTANIMDLRDEDSENTVFQRNPASEKYYGLESQPFISDIAFYINDSSADFTSYNSFAVELVNPFEVDIILDDYRLVLRNKDRTKVRIIHFDAEDIISDNSRFIIANNNNAFHRLIIEPFGSIVYDPNFVLAEYRSLGTDPPTYDMNDRYDIYLIKETADVNIYLDKQETADYWFDWDDVKVSSQYYCRSDDNLNVVYQTMSLLEPEIGETTFTKANGLPGLRKNYNFVVNTISSFFGFRNIGEIDRVLTIGPGEDPNDMLGVQLALEPPEWQVRIDPNDPTFENIFQYLTVIDPTLHDNPPEETRIKGRININTAPWFVMYQLPWIRPIPSYGPQIAQAIVNNRNSNGAFKSIAGLMRIPEMGFYAYDSNDLLTWPDLTTIDGAIDDLEERDIIFTRISNLVTVRSDVFTAYILVRVGADGPQKRVIAILDRSQVNSISDKVKILALHPVPDPR